MTESERLLHVARELSSRLGGAVQDMIPPEAQRHLINAQRELLTALFLIYEHQASGRQKPPRRRPRSATGSTRRAPRVSKIDVQ